MRNPVYGCKLYVTIGRTSEECMAGLPTSIADAVRDDLPKASEWDGYTFDITGGIYVIVLRVNAKGNLDYDAIFHEVSHCTAWMCDFHGVKVDPKDHEAFAYLTGWVGKMVMKALDKYRDKLKQAPTPPLNKRAKQGIISMEKSTLLDPSN
jgi:hypothetical protein